MKLPRPREPRGRVPSAIDRQFGWLEELGYLPVEVSLRWGWRATYAHETVLVRPGYQERDENVDITIARARATDLRDEPYWAQVHLLELIQRRAPTEGRWATRNRHIRSQDEAELVLALGATLLRTYGIDLLHGVNLDVLDDIIAKRPRRGVPGLDFPTSEPWALSAEGVLFTTDSEVPREMATYLERSRSSDPKVRALAALKIVIAARGTNDQTLLADGYDRLHELLGDPDADVYRAAASALGQWTDPNALDDILPLLDQEPGDRMSPVAAAMTFIAIDGSDPDKKRVLEALRRFATRGPVPAAQVDELAWRLGEGPSRGYPRGVRLWGGPDA